MQSEPKRHEPYQLLPPLLDDEYAALKANIEEHGVLVPVEFDEDGNILDGHHRLRIAKELGIDYPSVTRTGMSEQQKRSHARALNLHRRHLNRTQKRTLIADELIENPTMSNLAIATRLGVSDVTVGKVRRELGLTGDIIGADGKVYSSQRVEPKERLEYSVVFAEREWYDAFMQCVRQLKRNGGGRLISELITEAIQHDLARRDATSPADLF